MTWRIASLLSIAALAGAAVAAEPEGFVPVPSAEGLVNDRANVIESAAAVRLEAVLGRLRDATGAEVVVLTVPTTQPEPAFEWGMRVVEEWKPGDDEKDDGVLFLVAVEDRRVEILTGYGVEGILPDGKVGAILDGVVLPEFRRGDMSAGIEAGALAVARVVAEDAGIELEGLPRMRPVESRREGVSPLAAVLQAVFFLVIAAVFIRNPLLLLLFLGGGRRGGFGGGFGGGGFGGGGFGGFGGGGFGGGGAGRSW